MLADGRAVFAQAPWLMLAPGMCIVVFSTLAALTGDALRDLADPGGRVITSNHAPGLTVDPRRANPRDGATSADHQRC